MTNNRLLYTTYFVLAVLAQVFIFNNINFLGFINPYVYLLFVLLFPITVRSESFLIICFLLGLSIDFFSNSGGAHAAACVVVAYLRPHLMKVFFGVSYEYNTVSIPKAPFGNRLSYMSAVIAIHHLLLFSLEAMNIDHFLLVTRSALYSGVFTLLLCTVFSILLSKRTS